MFVELKQLFEVVGESQAIQYSLDPSDQELWGDTPFCTPISVQGSIVNRAGIVTLDVTCQGQMHLVCDRCLTPFDREFSLPVRHILVTGTNSDQNDEEYIVVEDLKLNLDELLRCDLLLALPSKVLCKEDCKGLCSQCGTNLNQAECQCKPVTGDPRLQILGDLLK